MKESKTKFDGLSRRSFFTAAAVAATGLLATKASGTNKPAEQKKKLGMVIDLHACTGCGACEVACKVENNVPAGALWASHVIETKGTFPNVQYTHYPTLCNHCDDAPCVQKCPTRAMYKDENTNLTLHDPDLCIGCTTCAIACPYGAISYNKDKPHARWRSDEELIPKCSGSGKEIQGLVKGNTLPYYNKERNETYPGIRPKGIVEKCTFCDHRLKKGQQPYCVEACPSHARIVGDFADTQSHVSQLVKTKLNVRLKEHMGTNPNVYYINGFNTSGNKL